MATGADLRKFALAIDGVHDAPHFDRTAFKAVRIFVTLAADGQTANFKFAPEEQELKCLVAPEAFTPLPNAWGRQGWTEARLGVLTEADLKAALQMARAHALPRLKARRKR